MGEPPDVATDRGVPFEWWYVVAAGIGAWALYAATTGFEGRLGTQLYDAIGWFAILAWPAIPLAMYLDLRGIRDEVAWEPATKSWLLVSALWIANVPAGLAYCLRRRQAVRGELPSPKWRYGVYVGLLVWIAVLAVGWVVGDADLGAADPVLTGILIVAWFGLPVALYFDATRFNGYPDQRLRIRILVALSFVPLLNVLLVGGYVVARWWHRRNADPDAEPTLPGQLGAEGAASGRPEPISPWYRRSVGVFVAYVLVAVAIGWGLALESDLAWNVLALVVWPLFGLAFVVCVHFDLRDVREAGVPWGRTRYLYYTSVVFSGPAFWYLLRRLTKVGRARSEGWIEEDGGAGGGGDGAGDGDGTGGSGNDGEGSPTIGRGESKTPPEETPGLDGSDVGESSGFEWGEGSRG